MLELSTEELLDLRNALDTAINADFVVFAYNREAWPPLLKKIKEELSEKILIKTTP